MIERVGIIGAGACAAVHLHALRRLSGKRVVAILDVHAERAVALAAKFGLPPSIAMDDAARFYLHARPQLVHIVTPPSSHQELASEALLRGVHVLVEKPAALSMEGCRLLQGHAQKGGVTVGINENTAHYPPIHRARRAIAAGRIGRLLHIDGFHAAGIRASEKLPRWTGELPGGMLEDLLPHLLTTARALAGEPLQLEHQQLISTGEVAGQNHDELRLQLKTEKHLSVSLALSLTARPRALSFLVRGTAGSLCVDLRDRLFFIHQGSGGTIAQTARLAGTSLRSLYQIAANTLAFLTGYRERYGSSLHSIQAHYAAIETGHEIPAPLSQAIQTVEIARRIWPLKAGRVGSP